MSMGLVLALGLTTNTAPSVAAPVAGASPTTFTSTPTVHYHPNSQTATLNGSNQVTACPDLLGLAAASGVSFGGADVGPNQMTDALGRKFWRFSSGQYLLINNALNALNMRQMMVFAVWRVAKVTRGTDFALLSLRYSAYTDDTTNTAQTNGYILRGNAATSTSEAARLKSGTVDSYANGIGGHFIPGAQIHVAGFNSRTTANGGGRFYINERTNDVAQTSLTATNGTGMIIGGKATTSNAVTGTTDNCYDLYELAIWKGTYTNAQSDTASAEMVANWGIQAITGQIIMTGDSITECIDTSSTVVIPQDGIAHKLAAPGAGYIPANFRVINIGIAGSALDTYAGAITGVDLDTQRDDTSSGFQMVYSGGAANNIVTVNIGINDMRSSVGNQTAAQHYARFVTLLNTGTTGYLQRGFKVVAVTPTSISGDATGQSRISAFRDLLINPTSDVIVSQFLTDVLANVGQTYDGLVSVLPIAKIQYASSGTIFADATDAGDTTYYATDGTHHTPLAMTLMVEGGSTPTYGYGPFLQATVP